MKKRAQEILHKELISFLNATTKKDLNSSLNKLATLANIFDQSGDEKAANRLDALLKEAGFWSSLLSGMSGGSARALWNAFKTGKFKESFVDIAKKALIGGATGVAVEYMIKWLDGLPIIGSLLQELEGADKLRSILEGVIASAVSESDLAEKLVDKAIIAIEQLVGLAHPQEENKATPELKPVTNMQGVMQKQPDNDTMSFEMPKAARKQ